MTQQNHVDSETLDMLVEILEDGFPALVETFISDCELRINGIKTGLQDSDADAVRRNAHSLKGSSGNVGAQRLAELSQQFESAARAGTLDGLPDSFAQLEAEFLTVKNILSRRLTTS